MHRRCSSFCLGLLACLFGACSQKTAPPPPGTGEPHANRLEAVGGSDRDTDRVLESEGAAPTVRTEPGDLPPPINPPSGSSPPPAAPRSEPPRNPPPAHVDPPRPSPPSANEPPPPELPRVRTHVVQKGETFYSIATRYYGSGRHWQKIYQANRKRVPDPAVLPVGTKLIIP
ncbi:MAG: LysM domain-containing protein [Phycisphaerae bacterium]